MYRNHMTLQLNSASSGRWMSNTYRLTAIQANYLTNSTTIPSLMRPVDNVLYSLSKSSRPTQLFNFSKWLLNTLAINQKSFKQIMQSSSPISKRPNKDTHLTYFVRNLALSINWFDHGLPDIMAKLNAVIAMTINVSTSIWHSILMMILSSRWKIIFIFPIDLLCRL